MRMPKNVKLYSERHPCIRWYAIPDQHDCPKVFNVHVQLSKFRPFPYHQIQRCVEQNFDQDKEML